MKARKLKLFLPVLSALISLLASCTSLPLGRRSPDREEQEKRLAIVQYARSLLGKRDLEKENPNFRNDCSGLVLGLYRKLGYTVELNRSRRNRTISDSIYRTLNERGYTYINFRPRPADVVFFKGTIEGRGDQVTHVGLVDGILPDGTIVIVNYTSGGVSELRMNLLSPGVHMDDNGNLKNDFLKRKPARNHASIEGEKLLSGELFFSFGNLLGYVLSDGRERNNLFE